MLKNYVYIFYFICFTSLIQLTNSKFFHNIYHTSLEILTKLDSLSSGSCQGILKKQSSKLENNELIYYIVDKQPTKPKQSVYILFGEHSRELISPELGLYMIETLCGINPIYDQETVNKILEQNKFLIVPIVNVPGKIAVENGNFCKRTNENGVDLNRNWNSHFKPSSVDDPDQYSGDHAFSEWQTRVLNQLLIQFKAKIFISVHSGALGMYSPPAYKFLNMKNLDQKFEKIKNLIKVLDVLNDKYCNCKAGPAANELVYLCPGNCLDYAYEKELVHYSFAFEIFTNQKKNKLFLDIINSDNPKVFNYKEFISNYSRDNLATLFIEKDQIKTTKLKGSFLQIDSLNVENLKHHDHSHDENSEYSCFAQSMTKYPRTKEFCLNQFNPLTQKHRDNTVINWTNVIFELVSLINQIDPST